MQLAASKALRKDFSGASWQLRATERLIRRVINKAPGGSSLPNVQAGDVEIVGTRQFLFTGHFTLL